MITPLQRKYPLDLSNERLGPGWLRAKNVTLMTSESSMNGLWQTGPRGRFRDELIAVLDNASEVALVCAFFLADENLADAMVRAAERGVRVYALTASEQRIGKLLREDAEFDQRMAEEHKALLDRLAGRVLLRSAEHFHAKFLVSDPQNPSQARAILSTANFNRALRDNIEFGVELDGEDACDLAAYFNRAFWCEASHELVERGRLSEVAKAPVDPPMPQGRRVFGTLRQAHTLRETVLSMIRSANREILLASYGMAEGHETVRALIEAARKGIAVTVLTRPRPAVAAAVKALAEAGARVVAQHNLHAKALVVDGRALVMSANFEPLGLDNGFEVGVVPSEAIASDIELNLRTWANAFPWTYSANATRGGQLADFLPADKNLRDGIKRIVVVHEQQCADQIAQNALRLEDAPQPPMRPNPRPDEIPQKIIFSWQVVPPQLPKGAKKRPSNGGSKPADTKGQAAQSPSIFDHHGKAYVVLHKLEEIEDVQRLAEATGALVVLP